MPTPTPAPHRPTGLVEHHAHLPAHGREMTMVALADCASVAECLERLSRERARLDALGVPRDTGWVVGAGARVQGWAERRWPTRDELDAVGAALGPGAPSASPRPVAVRSFDHHSGVASSAALAAAGVRDDSPDPAGGVIVREPGPRGPRATGLLLESAWKGLYAAIPEPTPAQAREQVRAALADLRTLGYAEVHDLLSPPWLGPVLADLHDAGELPLDVWLYAPLATLDEQHARARSFERPRDAGGSTRDGSGGADASGRGAVRLAGGKVFVDGTLNARTAWMLHPFREHLPEHPRGTPLMSVPDIRAALRRCRELDVSLAAHAIGDGAVRACIDAAEAELPRAARVSADGVARDWRTAVPFRVEHAELLDEQDVPRLAALCLERACVVSVQPCHLLYDIEALERFCPDRLERVMPFRDLLDAGLLPGRDLVFGSDVPIVRADPLDSLLAATQRRRAPLADGRPSPGGPPTQRPLAPAQALTSTQAWACFAPRGA